MKFWVVTAALLALNFAPSAHPASAPAEPWKALAFLEGTWVAHTQAGSANAQAAGTYTFKLELKRHLMARYSAPAACRGPKDFDCEHSDLLYVYQESDGGPLKAIYFDNEGHVIHYTVSAPEPAAVIFASEPSSSGPQFQLIYQLRDTVMYGKFQMRMPGQAEWKSYLEWSGPRK
jgi:hypothetical protein